MKRKFLIISFFFFFEIVHIFPADTRWYYDYSKGYSGYARADYLGTPKNINLSKLANECEQHLRNIGVTISGYCEKLSKAESFLMWSALEEYDYYQNEIYLVTIQQGKQILQLYVVIKDDGNSVDWYGGWYVWDPS